MSLTVATVLNSLALPPFDRTSAAVHSRQMLAQAATFCLERSMSDRDLVSALPLNAVRLWRENPFESCGEPLVPNQVETEVPDRLQQGLLQALIRREPWIEQPYCPLFVIGHGEERAVTLSAIFLAEDIKRWWRGHGPSQEYFRLAKAKAAAPHHNCTARRS